MSKFVTERINAIKARELVEQLVIDGIKQLDTFEQDLVDTTYGGELRTLLKYIEHCANGQSLPNTKFRQLKGAGDGVIEYEFKSKHLRIYAIQRAGGKLVVLLGYKNRQEKDITAFRSLKKRFLDFEK